MSSSEGPATPRADRRRPEHRPWEIYFAACIVVDGIVVALIRVSDPVGHLWVPFSLLSAMVLWYLALGHRVVATGDETWRGWLFQAILFALFLGGILAEPGTVSLLLFALCPLAYMTVRLRLAHLVVACYAFAPALVSWLAYGPATLPVLLAVGAIATATSIVIAATIARTERTSAERAALILALEATRADVARLSREAGIAAERQRLAGEIHDTVAQGLASVVMLVQAADASVGRDPEAAREHLRLAARTARENLDETRAIVAALTPAALDGAPLADALRRLIARFGEDCGVAAGLSTVGGEQPLPTGTEVVLLRVVQEALSNVRKHAGATEVHVELAVGEDAVRVRVRDDGIGFDAASNLGYGLGGMKARVEQIGGTLAITSIPGQGSFIEAEVPA